MSQNLQPTSRRALAVLLPLVLLGLMLAGCEIADPELPRFETRVALPLGEERLDIAEVVDDEEYLIAMEDGTLGFTVDGDPDTVSLDFDLAADIDAQNVSGSLGTFDLAPPPPAAFDFTLVDLYPAAAGVDGMSVPVPGFTFSSASSPEDLQDVESATLTAGTLTVTVDNGLPVPVSAASGPNRLYLELVDPSSGDALVTVEFDVIPAGGHAEQTADLAGVTLPGDIAVRLAGGSPGSGGSFVTVDASAAIAVDAAFSDLEVSAAEAVVPAQEFETSFQTDLPEDYGVVQAVIAAGDIDLAVVNEMGIPCQATVTWPEVVDLDDNPLELVIDLEPAGSASRTVDFAAHIVRAPGGVPITELNTVVTVTSPGSAGLPVLLEAGQGVQADLSAGRIEFGSVTGTVPELSYEFDSMDEEIDLPDEMDGLLLTQATLVLEMVNSAGLNAEADFNLVGINDAGDRQELQVSEQIDAATEGRAAVTQIILDQNNSGIVDFLNNMPTRITLEGGVNLGGDGATGTVRGGDYAVVNWAITSPVEVIVESSHLYGSPEDLGLDEDAREMIQDYGLGAEIQLEILNHLPVGVETRVLFSPDTTTIKTDPLLVIGPVTVGAASTNPDDHTVLEPLTSHPLVSITASETQVLSTEGLYSLLEVTLPSTEGNPVRVMITDYVTVQGLIYLDIDVHDE